MVRIAISLCLGYLLGLCSLYSALRVGFAVGVAFLTVLCWAALDRALGRILPSWRPGQGVEHACALSLTSAMSYGSATVIATALAAMLLAGDQPPLWAMIAWVAGMGCLGTCMAFILAPGLLAALRFPSGQAAGQLVSRLEQGGERLFLPTLVCSGAWVGLRQLVSLPARWPALGPWLEFSPLLLGLGGLLGLQVTTSMLAGALVFERLVPVLAPGWTPQLLFFATGVLVAATIASLARQGRGLPTAGWWRGGRLEGQVGLGLAVGVLLLALAYTGGWQVSPWLLVLLLPLLVLFAAVSGAVTGQTDVVPTGALGKLAILALGLSGQSQVMLHTGTLAGSAASAADFLTDLRTGEQLGCPPRRQFPYQLLGALIGPLLFVPTFLWLTKDQLGEAAFPVPAAQLWRSVYSLSESWQAHGQAIAWGLAVGLVMQLLEDRTWTPPWQPRVLPFAMAAVLDLPTCLTLTLGALVALKVPPERQLPLFSAMLCGEAVVAALLG